MSDKKHILGIYNDFIFDNRESCGIIRCAETGVHNCTLLIKAQVNSVLNKRRYPQNKQRYPRDEWRYPQKGKGRKIIDNVR